MIHAIFFKGERGERGARGQPGIMGPVGPVGTKVFKKMKNKKHNHLDLEYSIDFFMISQVNCSSFK